MRFGAILSSVIGLIFAFQLMCDALSDLWMYSFNEGEWLTKHSHGIGTSGFSFEHFICNDIQNVLIGLVIILCLMLSVKRYREIGVTK